MRESYLKLLPLVFSIIALLGVTTCTVVSTSEHAVDPARVAPAAEPSPTPTDPPATPTPESPTSTPEIQTESEGEAAAEADDPAPESEVSESENTGADSNDDANPEPQIPGRPVEIRIDRINVSAPFEYVGVTPEGNMDVPQGWDNVAWYEPGTIPGDQGNSVITGHYDRPGGGAAIFYDLKHLAPGDRITIITEHNDELVFEITEVELVHVDDAPLRKIFGKSDSHNLNLITCDGVWDSSRGMYDQRLIVYSTLVSA